MSGEAVGTIDAITGGVDAARRVNIPSDATDVRDRRLYAPVGIADIVVVAEEDDTGREDL